MLERLTLEQAAADTVLACEHRHRYEFAAQLCADLRVLDLCCGSGYGSAILCGQAASVVGVDNDAATISAAVGALTRHADRLSFALADAVDYLHGDLAQHFDAVVCFEGIEHLDRLVEALELLAGLAHGGMRVVASVPNSKLFAERNPYHVTDFGYDSAVAAASAFPNAVLLPQFLAEGSIICPPDAVAAEVAVLLDDGEELEYANHFILCANFGANELLRAHHGALQVTTAPIHNRWAEGMKHALVALQRENARLARAWLGLGGSAAAAALAAAPADNGAPRPDVRFAPEPEPEPEPEASDANSWEHRHRRAAGHLIPWIEQTTDLAGKTVLEYGCGHGPVTCAFAARAGKVIGVDIDGAHVEQAREEVAARGFANVELECHPPEEIVEAVRARAGTVDVFLCYAVLEHLTVEERLSVLRLGREILADGGHIVVCETPNRLVYLDHHTAQMPFFHLLPDELAAQYYERSARPDFRAAIDAAGEQGPAARHEAIVRWGRGVSFHEFEVVFGDLSRHVLASNYDPLLFAERPIHPEEVMLARYLDSWRPDLAPVWSRCWLDVILAGDPTDRTPSFLRPWTADTAASDGVAWTRAETLYLAGSEAVLRVTPPTPTTRVVVAVAGTPGPVVLRLRSGGSQVPLTRILHAGAGQAFATFTLAGASARIELSASRAIHVVFVGYER